MAYFALEIDDFSYDSGAAGSLGDVRLALEEGECLLLKGATGSGKTTILNALNGVIPAITPAKFGGRVVFKGQDYILGKGKCPPFSVYTVGQNPFHSFAAVNLDIPQGNGIDGNWLSARMEEASSYQDLSAGEKQRALLRQGFASEAEVLLLDEPLAHLDETGIAVFRRSLMERKKGGRGITIIAEHRWKMLNDLADKQVILPDLKVEKEEFVTGGEIRFPGGGNGGTTERLCKMKDVTLRLGGKEVLSEVNWQIASGEVCGITGANGSGKTTFAKAIAGRLKAVKGTVERRKDLRCSMLWEDPRPQLLCDSVEKEVFWAAENYRVDGGLPGKLVSGLGLAGIAQSNPLKVSYGQQERTVMAAVLAGNPDLVIFDEPVQGQDEKGISRLIGIIRVLKDSGKGVVVISHYLKLVEQAADRIYVLEGGKMREK